MTPQMNLKQRVWGPSVDHDPRCDQRISGGHLSVRYTCLKRFYCEGCDAMHMDRKCPRTVLDQIVEAVEFERKTPKQLIGEILDAAEARGGYLSGRPIEFHIKSRIEELVARHGNLGMTRVRLFNMIRKEMHRRWNREYRRLWEERRKEREQEREE